VAERLRRYVQVVVNFVGVGSIPTGCTRFFGLVEVGMVCCRLLSPEPEVPGWRNRQRARLLTGRL
jgi:hypothetical protein